MMDISREVYFRQKGRSHFDINVLLLASILILSPPLQDSPRAPASLPVPTLLLVVLRRYINFRTLRSITAGFPQGCVCSQKLFKGENHSCMRTHHESKQMTGSLEWGSIALSFYSLIFIYIFLLIHHMVEIKGIIQILLLEAGDQRSLWVLAFNTSFLFFRQFQCNHVVPPPNVSYKPMEHHLHLVAAVSSLWERVPFQEHIHRANLFKSPTKVSLRQSAT